MAEPLLLLGQTISHYRILVKLGRGGGGFYGYGRKGSIYYRGEPRHRSRNGSGAGRAWHHRATWISRSLDLSKGEAAATTLRKDGVEHVEAIQFDVANYKDHVRIAQSIERRSGWLDILVNNSGIAIDDSNFGAPGGFNTTSTVSQMVLHETFETNFFAVVSLTQTLLPLIKRSTAGRIVNLSSILGSMTLQADPTSPVYSYKAFAYDSSKTALNAFTVHLAAELRNTPIKVNSAHPGWVKTSMGGPAAQLEVDEGGKTSVQLATLPADGPTGGYFHLGQPLPW